MLIEFGWEDAKQQYSLRLCCTAQVGRSVTRAVAGVQLGIVVL